MADPPAHVPLHRHLAGAEQGRRLEERAHRHEIVRIAVDQQRRRPGAQLALQVFAAHEPAREAQHAGTGRGAAIGDVERHHRALAEAHQREVLLAEPERLEPGVDIGVDRVRRAGDAFSDALGRAVAQAEPLPPHGRHVAGLRRVRRGEAGVGHEPPPGLGEADQVVAVGAEAVQQEDQLARLASARRRPFRTRQGAQRLSPLPVVDEARIMAARPASGTRHGQYD